MSGKQTLGQLRIQKLYVYPIKSLRGMSLPALSATESGFVHDRQFMLWNVSKSQTLHIGLQSALCLFTTKFDSPTHPMSVEVLYGLDSTYDKPDQKVSNETLSVPLSPRTEDLEVLDITMHKSPTKAYDMGASYNEWFSKRLGFEVKLLYIGKNRRKVLGNLPPKTKSARVGIVALITACTSCLLAMLLYTNRTSTPRVLGLVTLSILFLAIFVLYRPVGILPTTKSTIGRKGHNITFADLAPYLVISTKSVQNIQGRLPEDAVLDLTKFRPNIVIDGATEAFEEDFWAELLIGDNTTITLTQNCARCNSLNVDYKTGKTASDATGKILKLLSKDRRVDSGTKWSPVFGRYGFLTASDRNQDTVSLREGDAVRVSARNQQRTTLDYPK